jgi:hypothetical protein
MLVAAIHNLTVEPIAVYGRNPVIRSRRSERPLYALHAGTA